MKLTIELVPKTCWYTNVRSEVTRSVWDKIRKKSYAAADHKCEVCEDVGTDQGYRHKLECHEIWDYNDVNKTQTLAGFISLCPRCHKCKHPGLAQIKGEMDIVISQLMKVNEMSEKEAVVYVEEQFDVWQERSQHQWALNTKHLIL